VAVNDEVFAPSGSGAAIARRPWEGPLSAATSKKVPDHLSGTLVAERPEEQLAPKSPIFNALALYIAVRSRIDAVRANGQAPLVGTDLSAGAS
jgi:hypothetical protein